MIRLYWVKDLTTFKIITLRFTRLPFGCTSSPFNLGGTLNVHLDESKQLHVEEVKVVEEI